MKRLVVFMALLLFVCAPMVWSGVIYQESVAVSANQLIIPPWGGVGGQLCWRYSLHLNTTTAANADQTVTVALYPSNIADSITMVFVITADTVSLNNDSYNLGGYGITHMRVICPTAVQANVVMWR